MSLTRSAHGADRSKNRTRHERLRTLEFWRSLGRGTLLLEYPIVFGGSGSHRRAVDALVVLDGDFEELPWRDAPALAGRSVMIIQTKAHRTDATLVGQAVFSPILLRRQNPGIGAVESVVLTTGTAPALSDLLKRHDVSEFVIAAPDAKLSHATYPRVDGAYLNRLHSRLGGEMFLGVRLTDEASSEPLVKLDALILPECPVRRTVPATYHMTRDDLSGARVVGVVTTRLPLGMGISGFALVAQHLLRRAGAVDPRVIAVVGQDDLAVRAALHSFPGLSAQVVESLD